MCIIIASKKYIDNLTTLWNAVSRCPKPTQPIHEGPELLDWIKDELPKRVDKGEMLTMLNLYLFNPNLNTEEAINVIEEAINQQFDSVFPQFSLVQQLANMGQQIENQAQGAATNLWYDINSYPFNNETRKYYSLNDIKPITMYDATIMLSNKIKELKKQNDYQQKDRYANKVNRKIERA